MEELPDLSTEIFRSREDKTLDLHPSYGTNILSLASSRAAVSLIITRMFGTLSILSFARSAWKSEGSPASTSHLEIETGLPCNTQTLLLQISKL